MLDYETRPNPIWAAQSFLADFEEYRAFNREFYRRVRPEDVDIRVVDPLTRRADSARDSWLYQMYVTRNYAYSLRLGVLYWGAQRESMLMPPALQTYSKLHLMDAWRRIEEELNREIYDPEIRNRFVKVPWVDEPIPALQMLQGLLNQEMLAAVWNRALMRHLGMQSFSRKAAAVS